MLYAQTSDPIPPSRRCRLRRRASEFSRARGISVAGTPERGAVVQKARELVEFARCQGFRTTWSRSSKTSADTTLSRRVIVLPVYLLHAVDDTSDATAFDALDRVWCHAVRERDEDLLLNRW